MATIPYCRNGHAYDEENTGWWWISEKGVWRYYCKICKRKSHQKHYWNNREAYLDKTHYKLPAMRYQAKLLQSRRYEALKRKARREEAQSGSLS